MTLDSVNFAVFIVTFVLIYAIGSTEWRQRTLCLASLVFLVTYITNLQSLVALSIILMTGYIAIVYARHRGRVDRSIILYILVSIAVFMVLKKYQVLKPFLGDNLLQHSIFIIGYSYLLFRQIQMTIDAAQQTLGTLSPLAFLTFNLNFLTLLAGPIQRYQDFYQQWEKLGDYQFDIETSLLALNRIAGGYVAVYVIAPFLRNLPATSEMFLLANASLQSVINFYTYPFFMFFNFAGYCSIVIGLGQLIGIKLPENFRQPYLSRDPLDFWNRWHITLSQFLRDYLFTPLYKTAITHSTVHIVFWVIIAYFVTFLVAGLWHGTTVNYIVLGVIYGGGAAIAKTIETVVQRRFGRAFHKRLAEHRIVNVISILITLHFVAFSFIFIQNDYSYEMLKWFKSLFGGSL